MKLPDVPRVINDFEGGPSHLFMGNYPYSNKETTKPIVLYVCKTHQVFKDEKVTPTIDAIVWEKMPLVKECEECDECDENCEMPIPTSEIGDKGSGMVVVEVLEGWFIDLGKCIPWKVCECCKGKGYIE